MAEGITESQVTQGAVPPLTQHKKITEGEADLYLDQYNFTTTAAIVGSVDRKVFVLLRDGKMLFGVLRTFDQYANLILEYCVERIYFTEKNEYAEEPRGLFMVRGENVVMLGEVDIDKEDQPLENMERISFKEALRAKRVHDESRFKHETVKGKQLARYGILYDFHKSDMY
ncbi:LSM1 (YJL124C) [Zygosaccharomyces parabailii]|uniref:U6 snRNA-associated Sm-like protein LSm1 n=1 Tax=Zygosaccharomyces bailii (strain CLIB 213 / ATCC 58445 / CBS 680 / BCRC 21525 / NBRC 1098 / NCYC 1416 / NRRL Y-2227) TaxID=1333698 RepID=A0A8J2T3S9_ZYGB2|nr:LSM1 (YJL124C) [Zygosaccharomyces parabailii]CDF87411.1 BN860_05754g1_1 [Zygosaccharomyces bailii CLIB 213]CDH15524.1 probable LSM1-Sm-like (Lsm) protein [Zygosaccharomyces bailii ISA1307]SJM85074.1 probable Sm-like protein LSm1 [Zygosaccharomyces bailii]